MMKWAVDSFSRRRRIISMPSMRGILTSVMMRLGLYRSAAAQTLLAVGRLAYHHAVHGGPVHAQHDAAAHYGLVVNDQYL